MTVTDATFDSRRMCSLMTKASGEDPIGSVTAFDRLLLVEVPLPWPRAVRAAPRFPAAVDEVLTRADRAGIPYRMYGIVPDAAYTPPGSTRLIHLQRPAGAMSVFTKEDFVVPHERLGGLVQAIFEQSAALNAFAPFRQDTASIRDVLVCTHGGRDLCCGSFGFPAYRELRRGFTLDGPQPSRAWRVSHIGGHRFAPTLLDLPTGRCWAQVDDDALAALLRGVGPLPDLDRHYRGWAALRSVPEMVAERAVLAEAGRTWTTRTVTSEIIVPTDPITGATSVRLTYSAGLAGGRGYYEAVVEPSGVVTRGIGSCGDEAVSEHLQFRVSQLEQHEGCLPAQTAMETMMAAR